MDFYNVAQPLAETAARVPFRPAIVFPAGRDQHGRSKFIQLTFQQLNQESDRYAHGLSQYGIRRGDRTLMLLRPGLEFVALAFALLKIGAIPVLIDPGMGRRAFLQCVAETEPVNLIGISTAHVLRKLFPGPFRAVQRSITVGKRWFWRGARLDDLWSTRRDPFPIAPTTIQDEAAIAFTSGSTGIPKGVIFLHGTFKAQIDLLHNEIGYVDGGIDLPGLYIFALYNPALGVTTILPDMDPSRTAEINPAYVVESIQTHGVTTSFGSPTIWKIVGQYCIDNDIQLSSLHRILMAGAPVSPSLIAQYRDILTNGDVYTPFGATEALPITMMSGDEILTQTAELTKSGHGICVGRPTRGTTIRIIEITKAPILQWDESLVLPRGKVGEIVVKGPVVTQSYLNRPQQNAEAKIREGAETWHRMGDLGYFDDQGRLWFCGRKKHRVETSKGMLFPVQCEAIFNCHPALARSALVGVGEMGKQRPILIVELPKNKTPISDAAKRVLIQELLALGAEHQITHSICDVLFHPDFPVDVRHNAKIQREKLAIWAEKQL